MPAARWYGSDMADEVTLSSALKMVWRNTAPKKLAARYPD